MDLDQNIRHFIGPPAYLSFDKIVNSRKKTERGAFVPGNRRTGLPVQFLSFWEPGNSTEHLTAKKNWKCVHRRDRSLETDYNQWKNQYVDLGLDWAIWALRTRRGLPAQFSFSWFMILQRGKRRAGPPGDTLSGHPWLVTMLTTLTPSPWTILLLNWSRWYR